MTLKDKNKYSFVGIVQSLMKNRFLIFTALFLIAGYFVFQPYREEGRSLVCNGDASIQHYPALAYYGSFIREIIKTFLFEHRIEIPSWDMTIGYGGDIVSTLHYYCVGDPLALISVVFRADQSELCYNLLIVLRLYLSGMAMLCYCKHMKLETYSSVVGALVYCFSGYAISPGVFHPFFSTPMIYFPLILLGSELLFEKKNPCIFIASVALALLSNFYFFYMMVILVVMYFVLRYFTINKKFDIKDFGRTVLKFFSFALIGILIAMPVFLPNIVSLLQSDRISVDRVIPAFYPEKYYMQLPEGIISEFGSYYVYLSISAVAILSLFVLLSKFKKENIPLIISVFVLLSFLLLPKIGSAFNGFNYVTNRWIWALTFVFGYVTAKVLPMAEELNWKHFIGIFACTAILYLACYIPDKEISEQTKVFFYTLAFCVLLIILVSAKFIPKIIFRNIIAVVAAFTVCVNAYYHASPQAANWAGNSHEEGQAFTRYYESIVRKVNELPNDGEGRYDGAKGMFDYNTAILYDMGGTGFYFSTINPGAAEFQREQMLNYSVDQQFRNLDGRTYLAAAMSVKYFMAHENTSHPKLYGYNVKVGDKIYTSEHTLPLVYVFDSVYTDFESMTVTQKQQALLQRAFTESDYGLPDMAPEFSDYEVPFKIVDAKNVTVSDNGFVVSKPKATMTVSFDSVEDCELYCIFEGVDFEPSGDVTETNVKITCGQKAQVLQYKTAMNNYTSDRHDFLLNLGYNENGRTEFKVTFPDAGKFTFSDFRVVAQPMDSFFGYVDKLADSGVSDIDVNKDVITFSLERQKPGIAVISIPYQNGWKATVNGEKVDIIKVQGGLCGIYVEEGQHDVILEYRNPVTIPSYIMFFGGVALLTTIVVVYKKREKEIEKENDKIEVLNDE